MARRKHDGEIHIAGFVRAALVDHKTGKMTMGDWHKNAITQRGFQDYIVGTTGAVAGSSQVGYMQLASQTAAPNSTQTSALGEFTASGNRKQTTNACVASQTLQMTASWATNEGNESNVGAVAMYHTNTGGSAASVATFATSAKTTNQTLNITYEYRFT